MLAAVLAASLAGAAAPGDLEAGSASWTPASSAPAAQGPEILEARLGGLPVAAEAPLGAAPAYRRSHGVPLLEVGVVLVGLNLVDRKLLGYRWAETDLGTFRRNLVRWQYDRDAFTMNNLMHPINGSIYYGAARSMGLDLWRSFGIAFLGSGLWEVAGETEPASINDQILTPFGGAFLGEVLYRSAVLLLGSGRGSAGFWREAGAFLLSPPAGVNRRLFGDRYRTFDFDQRPVHHLEFGAGGGVARDLGPPGRPGGAAAGTARLQLHLAYGLPGEGGWPVGHPFDHFDVRVALETAARDRLSGELFIRGMLSGSRLEGGWRGVWGLTGIFDCAVPRAFRVATAALGISTTGQLGVRGGVALQGTALLGAGFGTGGPSLQTAGDPDSHRGPAAQLALEARLLLRDRAVLGARLREYWIAGTGRTRGFEDLGYLSLSGLLRLAGPHAVGVEWQASRRRAGYPGVPEVRQAATALTVSYVLVTDPWLGAHRARDQREDD